MWKKLVKVQGFDGYTPKKGVDYFTEQEVESIVKEIKKEATPVKGVDYKDGNNGRTPVKGVDYLTKEELDKIKREVKPVKGKDYDDGKDGSPDTPYEIRDKLSKLRGNERLDAKHIKNLNKEISLVVSGISSPSGSGGGVTAHSDLTELDYASSGHTGFAPAGEYLTAEDLPEVPSDISELTDTTGIIPTNTNELTNGAGFITSGDIPAIPEDVSDLTDTTGLLGDASKIQGFDVTTTGPTDGKILVYRTASNSYVMEDKPAAGANPSAADVAFTPAGNIAAINVQDALQEVDNEKIATAVAIAFAVAL